MISCYDNHREKKGYKDTFFNIRLDLLVCLLLALSILTVYWQARNHDFVNFDDNLYVTDNRHVQSGINLDSIIWAFSFDDKEKTYWHPITWLSHMLDCQLYGLNPGMHHSTNLIFHIANTILLFLVFRRMTGEIWKSALVAALFGLHPLNVESVAWVSERKNVLSTFFWILTMVAYVRYSERPGFYRYLPVFLLFMLGQLVKPMLVTLPFALLLLDYWPLGRLKIGREHHFFRLIGEKVPLIIVSALSVYLSVFSLQHQGVMQSTEAVPIALRIENALVSYFVYIVKSIWPQNLAVYYPYPDALPLWQTAGALLVLACVSLVLLLGLKHIPSLSTGWLWYIGTFVPVIGLVQAGLWPAMADRWAYIPAIGIFIIIVWGGAYLFAKCRCRKWIPAAASIALLSILMTSTWLQVQYWNNSITLYRHTLDVTSNNHIMHYNMGTALGELGKSKEAMVHYRKALDIHPAFHIAHDNLGFELARQGKDTEAVFHYRKALRIDPTYGNAHNNLGNALIRQEKLNEAIEHYNKALKANPLSAGAHKSLGLAMLRTGHIEPAIFHLEASLQSEPSNRITQDSLILAKAFLKRIRTAVQEFRKPLQSPTENASDLADTLDILTEKKAEMFQVIDQYEKALSLQPYFERNQLNINNLPQVRKAGAEYNGALALFETADSLQPGNPKAHYHAACVYARQNENKRSITRLGMAVKTGFSNPRLLEMDRDLEDIRGSSNYGNLLKTSYANAKKLRSDGSNGTLGHQDFKRQSP